METQKLEGLVIWENIWTFQPVCVSGCVSFSPFDPTMKIMYCKWLKVMK